MFWVLPASFFLLLLVQCLSGAANWTNSISCTVIFAKQLLQLQLETLLFVYYWLVCLVEYSSCIHIEFSSCIDIELFSLIFSGIWLFICEMAATSAVVCGIFAYRLLTLAEFPMTAPAFCTSPGEDWQKIYEECWVSDLVLICVFYMIIIFSASKKIRGDILDGAEARLLELGLAQAYDASRPTNL